MAGEDRAAAQARPLEEFPQGARNQSFGFAASKGSECHERSFNERSPDDGARPHADPHRKPL